MYLTKTVLRKTTSSYKMESELYNLLTKKIPNPDDFIGEFHQVIRCSNLIQITPEIDPSDGISGTPMY